MTAEQPKINVMVVFGGQSGEHDVSLRSAQTVIAALDPARYNVRQVGITRDGGWIASGDPMTALTANSPLFALGDRSGRTPTGQVQADVGPPMLAKESVDVVFPVLHGPMGEDGTIQGMLELTGIAYVGSGVLGSALAMDKAMAKLVLAQAGIPQGKWALLTHVEWEEDADPAMDRLLTELGLPVFVKPANMGSSVGVSKAHDAAELRSAIELALGYDRRIVVEAAVSGRELEIAVLGNDKPIASVAGEIIPCNEFYDYDAKYVDDDSELIIPAELTPEQLGMMQQISVQAFRALDLAGLARVDFFLEEAGGFLVNEVNTIPGFTSISMYPMLWEASGVPLPELVDRLIELAVERHGRQRRIG